MISCFEATMDAVTGWTVPKAHCTHENANKIVDLFPKPLETYQILIVVLPQSSSASTYHCQVDRNDRLSIPSLTVTQSTVASLGNNERLSNT